MHKNIRLPRLTAMLIALVGGCAGSHDSPAKVDSDSQADIVLGQTAPHPCGFHLGIKPWDGNFEGFNACTGNFEVSLFSGVGLIYNSMDSNTLGPAGYGVRLGMRDQLIVNKFVRRILPNGEQLVYQRNEQGGFTSPPETQTQLSNPSPDRWVVRIPGGTMLNYSNLNGQWLVSSIQDRNNNTITIGRDAQNEETSVTDAVGNVTSLSWSGGLLRSVTNAEGLVWSLSYDGNNNLVAIGEPAVYGSSPTTSLRYGPGTHLLVKMLSPTGELEGDWNYFADGALAGMTDAAGRQSAVTSCADHVSVTDAFRQTETLQYSSGRMVQITGPDGLSHGQFSYDGLNRLISTVDWLGKTESYAYNDTHDIVRYTDRFGLTTSATWDQSHNPLSVTDSTGKTTTFTYDSHDLPTSIRDSIGRVTTLNRDGNGNLLSLVGSDHTVIASASYGSHGEILSASDDEGRTTRLSYDSHLNPSTVSSPEGLVDYFSFSPLGRLLQAVNPLWESESIGYDSANRATSETLPNGGAIYSALDADARPIGIFNYTGPTPLTWTGSYAPDGDFQSTAKNYVQDQLAPAAFGAGMGQQAGICQ